MYALFGYAVFLLHAFRLNRICLMLLLNANPNVSQSFAVLSLGPFVDDVLFFLTATKLFIWCVNMRFDIGIWICLGLLYCDGSDGNWIEENTTNIDNINKKEKKMSIYTQNKWKNIDRHLCMPHIAKGIWVMLKSTPIHRNHVIDNIQRFLKIIDCYVDYGNE